MPPHKRFGEHGYTMTPHSYWTILPRKVSGMAQFLAIGYIMDRTFGAPGNPTWAKISGPQLARISGMTAKAFSLVLDDAVTRGLVERKEDGRGFQYRAWPEAWTSVADYVIEAKPDEPEEPAIGAESEAPIGSPLPTQREDMAIATGKSKPIEFRIALKGVPDPIDLKLPIRNDSGLALVFRTTISEAGKPSLTVLSGEPKPAAIGSALPIADNLFDKKQRVTDFTAYINAVALRHFPTVPDPALMKRIIAAAGSATVNEFAQVVAHRLKRGGRHQTALLVELAKDAARNASAAQALVQEELRQNPAQPKPDRSEFLRGVRDQWAADPELCEIERKQDPAFFAEVMAAAAATA